MPAAMAMRVVLVDRLVHRPSRDANPAEICPVVPSRPPEPIVSAEATIFTALTRARMPLGLW